MSKLANHSDADEVANDTFSEAWQYLAGFRSESTFKTWLTTILDRTIARKIRRRAIGRKAPLVEPDSTPARIEGTIDVDIRCLSRAWMTSIEVMKWRNTNKPRYSLIDTLRKLVTGQSTTKYDRRLLQEIRKVHQDALEDGQPGWDRRTFLQTLGLAPLMLFSCPLDPQPSWNAEELERRVRNLADLRVKTAERRLGARVRRTDPIRSTAKPKEMRNPGCSPYARRFASAR